MKKLPKLIHLPASKLAILAPTTCLVVVVALGLRWLGFAKVRQLLQLVDCTDRVSEKLPDEGQLDDLVWAVTAATNTIAGANTCLIRSLVLRTLLAAQGLESNLVIGVRCQTSFEASMSAHAWVEYCGRILIGESADTSLERLGTIAFR